MNSRKRNVNRAISLTHHFIKRPSQDSFSLLYITTDESGRNVKHVYEFEPAKEEQPLHLDPEIQKFVDESLKGHFESQRRRL